MNDASTVLWKCTLDSNTNDITDTMYIRKENIKKNLWPSAI
jgi:hypothetical protein